jgi:hypothetical protein
MGTARIARSASAARPRRQRGRGQSMIEFSLCFPLLLLLVLGTVDFSQYLQMSNDLQSVIRDGSRYASIYPEAFTTACPNGPGASGGCTLSDQTVEGIMQGEAWSLTLAQGGINLMNTDCTWSGTEPSQSVAPAATQGSSCITIAYYPSSSNAAGAPSWSPSTAACSKSNCGLKSTSIPNGSWDLVPCGYWSVSAATFTPASNYTEATCTATGSLVLVTAAVSYTPITPLFRGLPVLPTAVGSYAMEVNPAS